MRNVHVYDGKLPIHDKMLYTEDQMKKIVNDAENFLSRMRVDARLMTENILSEGVEKNTDTLNNNADAKKLLVAVLERISSLTDKQDQTCFYDLLEEQLCDMKNLGQCPQGRTVRLWQLFQSLEQHNFRVVGRSATSSSRLQRLVLVACEASEVRGRGL